MMWERNTINALTILAGASACIAASGLVASAPAETQAISAAPADDARCTALNGQKLDTAEVVSASFQPANTVVPGAFFTDYFEVGIRRPIGGLPAFCRIVARSQPEPGSNVNFEVWLPYSGWNGRYNAVGNGGYAGPINYMEMASAVASGLATASTDTGHEGSGWESIWARGNPQKIRDYGWRAVHLMSVNAKALVSAYYGRPADKSYFMSCSNGGRQALMEASRFPEDYDGIIAGAPVSRFTSVITSMLWSAQSQLPTGAALLPEQAKLIGDEVLAQCDSSDGISDGAIADPRQCRFDATKLACGTNPSAQCLSPPQLTALARIVQGPHTSRGRRIAHGYPLTDAIMGKPMPNGWETWLMMGGSRQPAAAFYPKGMLENFVARPFADLASFDWDRHPQMLTGELAPDLDAQPNIRRFFDRGGKLIIWHGWADAAIPPQLTIDFYQGVLRHSGPRARDSVRLFMVPGLQHCVGGTGVTAFGQIGWAPQSESPERHVGMAVQHWVEHRRAPESLVGRINASPVGPFMPGEKQRLLCAWPKRPVLVPGGDPDKASGYVCRQK